MSFKKVLEDFGIKDYPIDESFDIATIQKEAENIKKKVINEKFDILDNLLNYSLKAKVEYSDISIWKMFLSYGSIIGESTYSNGRNTVIIFVAYPAGNILYLMEYF